MFKAEICLCKPCRLVLGPREGGGPVPGARLFALPVRDPSSYKGCRGVAVICRRRSLSSGNSAEDGGRGSELLLRLPACHVLSSAVERSGCGDGDGNTFCADGLRILIEELRCLPELDLEGISDCAAGCGTGRRVVVVTVGCVVVVE